MKLLVQRIATSPLRVRAVEWGKLVIITGSTQALVQGLGLISGILVIRLLPTQEYALYTLANTMLGTMAILADGGISAGVMAQGGKVWQNSEQLGEVLVTGAELRSKFAVGSLLVATPILLYLLHHHGASWLMAVMLAASLIPAFFTGLSASLLSVAPMLHQDIVPIQKNQASAALGRVTLLTLTLFTFPWACIAILTAGLPQIWANTKLRKISVGYADWNQRSNLAIRKEILAFVGRILPGSIYYCLSGQITIWIISVFGSTTSVAQVGALGRLVMILGLISTVFSTLVLPRFARLPNKISLLLSRYLQIQIGLITISCAIIFVVWLFPVQILWVLGKSYLSLKAEIILSMINGCLGLITGTSFAICTSRGWAIHPVISIPITLVAIACGVVLFNINSLHGILLLNIFIAAVEVTMYFSYTLLRILKVK
jgi:O-antigen/teichoic acid export membrane protein